MNLFITTKNPETAPRLTTAETPFVREYLGVVANAVYNTLGAAERHPIVHPHLANTSQQVGFAAGAIATAEAEKHDKAAAIIDRTYEMMGLNGAPTIEAEPTIPDSPAGLVSEAELLAIRRQVEASYVSQQEQHDA